MNQNLACFVNTRKGQKAAELLSNVENEIDTDHLLMINKAIDTLVEE